MTLVIALTALAAFALAVAMVPAQSHGGNHGTIKVHDQADADPDQRNEPHVDCDFWIEGFNMHGASGEIVVYSWPPTGDKTEVLRDEWEGELEDDEDGHHFLVGPYELASGHYRVEAFADDDHDHFAKAKMFWVECGDEAIACPPTDLQATALDDGSIHLSFEVPDNATGTNVYRAEDDGEFVYITTLGPENTTYLDTDTEIGTTYTYMVNPLFGDVEAQGCETASATAIPVFTTVLGAGLAAVLGIGAYTMIGRRH